MTRYTTAAEYAKEIGKAEAWVAAKCRSKEWPHLGVGKSIRFTDEQIRQIEELLTVEPSQKAAAANSWGRKGRAS